MRAQVVGHVAACDGAFGGTQSHLQFGLVRRNNAVICSTLGKVYEA
jgi:hypothetical protein